MSRSFTYIDDVIESIGRLLDKPPTINENFDKKEPNPANSWCSHRIFNLGNNK